jgi:hypothetical protein
MQNILRPTSDPLGGNKDIYFIPDVDLNAVNRVLKTTVSLDYAPTKKFYLMECVHASVNVVEAAKKGPMGKLYDITINALVAGNINDNDEVFDEMQDYRFVIARTDNNCNTFILGNTEQPLEFNIVNSTKNAAEQRKETQITFTGQCYMNEKTLDGTLQVYS